MWPLRRTQPPPPPPVPPTRAPLALGGIAAFLQAIEIERLLTGGVAGSIIGLEHFHDLASRAAVTTRLVRNRRCRFDHVGGGGDPIGDRTVREVFDRVPGGRRLRVLGRVLVRSRSCEHCGAATAAACRFVTALDAWSAECPACAQPLRASALDLADGLVATDGDPVLASLHLSHLGIGEGDLLLVETDRGLVLLERREEDSAADRPPLDTVVLAGLGNIGSNLLDCLVRMQPTSLSSDRPGRMARLIVIDPDTYEAGNLAGQRIDAGDIGSPKALVQARKAQRSRPFLSVVAYVRRLEEVPPGVMRGAVVAGCLDSRAARMALAEAAWRMGAPYVDAAVDATTFTARIAGYMHGPGNACLECSFHDDDYEALEQRVSCSTPVPHRTDRSDSTSSQPDWLH